MILLAVLLIVDVALVIALVRAYARDLDDFDPWT